MTCGYTPSATITSVSGAITAKSNAPTSRDSVPSPSRLCIERWNRRIAYTAASATPVAATTPNTSLSSSAPNRIRISPTKLGVPGMASVASATTRNSVASTGARKAMPPSRSSVAGPLARAASTAMMKNSAAVTSAWLTICISAPCAPFSSRLKMPRQMKPSCAIEE